MIFGVIHASELVMRRHVSSEETHWVCNECGGKGCDYCHNGWGCNGPDCKKCKRLGRPKKWQK